VISILLTNDDGYGAPGLAALENALAQLGRVTVVAPDREQSSTSHALTLHRPLRVRLHGARHFSVDGTPTDCVYLGVVRPLEEPPQLVVSGINRGLNVGDDVTYSGTVAAAFEAALLGVPAFAVSLDTIAGGGAAAGAGHPAGAGAAAGGADEYGPAARLAVEVARRILEERLPSDTILNVNVPRGSPHGVRFTRQGKRIYTKSVEQRQDPRRGVYYWIGGEPTPAGAQPDSDLAAVLEGYAAITPLQLDLTDSRTLARISRWQIALPQPAADERR
jgi:5'-nucleotidase